MYPRAQVSTIVGRPAKSASHTGATAAATASAQLATAGGATPPVALGNECYSHASPLATSRPVVNGIVQNWPDMAALWRHLFEEHLKVRAAALAVQKGSSNWSHALAVHIGNTHWECTLLAHIGSIPC